MVNYTLAGGGFATQWFFVRSNTGEICIKSPIDRETTPVLELSVIATDRGKFSCRFIIDTRRLFINQKSSSWVSCEKIQ